MDMIAYQTADLTIGLFIVAVAAVLFIGRLFLQGSEGGQSFQEDDTPTTLSSRGAYINMIVGTRRIGPMFGWAGNRFTREEEVGSTGGKKDLGGGGGGSITQTVYFEDGWHQLGIGPASTLRAIYENGKDILNRTVSKSTTPNGSVIETEAGRFQIYWGDFDQPISADLSSRLGGIPSRWPYLCYILWLEKRLGTSPTWPAMEYEISSLDCPSNADIEGSFEPVLSDASGTITGVNPATILYQLLSAPWPHGSGLDPSLVDFTTLDELGLRLGQAAGNQVGNDEDFFPMNFLLKEGDNLATDWIQSVLLDSGVLMPDHPNGLLVFMPVREIEGAIPLVGEEFQTQPEVEVEVIPFNDVDQFDKAVFTYKDSRRNYRDNTVSFDNDAATLESKRSRITKVKIKTVTDRFSARNIANRRSPEILGDLSNIKYEVVRGASLLLPGQVFEDAEGRIVRVLSAERKTNSPVTILDCGIDVYGLPALDNGDDDDPGIPPAPASTDIQFTFLEAPESLSGSANVSIGVLRARRNRRQAGAFIWVSINDGASYDLIGNQNAYAAGFVLSSGVQDTDGPELIENGPTMVTVNKDATEVISLIGQESEWQNGRQLMVIESATGETEAFFLRNIELQAESEWQPDTVYNIGDIVVPTAQNATGLRYLCTDATGNQFSGTNEPDWAPNTGINNSDNELVWLSQHFEYQAKGMIRARFEGQNKAFAQGDKVWIIETARVKLLSSPSLITPGETVCLKTQPFTSTEEVNIDNVQSVCKVVDGDAVDTGGLSFIVTGDGQQIKTHLGERLAAKEA